MKKRTICALAALLLLSCFLGTPVSAQEKNGTAPEVTKKCKVRVSTGSIGNITDGKEGTAWLPHGSGEMRLMVPQGTRYVEISWYTTPKDYTVTEYDADKNELAVHNAETDSFPCIRMVYPLHENTRYVVVGFKQKGQGVSGVRAFGEGTLPPTVVQWKERPEKCDLMVFSTHIDDEWLWFGSIIPYYQLVRQKNVQVVYVRDCGRMRSGEALSANAVAGMTHFPLFLGLREALFSSYKHKTQGSDEEDALTEVLVKTVRKYKPEVILTHGWGGEYGHEKHKIVSRIMDEVIAQAADPEKYPESAQEYGAWQVKKLYRHSWKEQVLQFDWHVPYEELGGRTGLQVATQAMEQNKSQLKSWRVQDGGKYDNSLFGLCFSTVGDDVLHNDLFENIDGAAMPASEPEAAQEDTALEPDTDPASDEEAAPEPESVETEETETDAAPKRGWIAGIAAAGIVLAGVVTAMGIRTRGKKSGKHKKGKHRKQG